jgi:hypothetical protein
MLRRRGGQNKVTFTLRPTTGASVSSKSPSVTPGTVFYWLGLAVLLILVAAIVWNLFTSPGSLGI